jgi:hypothetical protein
VGVFPIERKSVSSFQVLMAASSELARPRKGHKTLAAACLGLLLLVSGCVLTHGETDNMLAEETGGGWRFSSLLDSLVGAFHQKETVEQANPSDNKTEEVVEDDPQATAEDEAKQMVNELAGGKKWGTEKALDMKKEAALKQQEKGVPCPDCIDDGHGNKVPPFLQRAEHMMKISAQNNKSGGEATAPTGRSSFPLKNNRSSASSGQPSDDGQANGSIASYAEAVRSLHQSDQQRALKARTRSRKRQQQASRQTSDRRENRNANCDKSPKVPKPPSDSQGSSGDETVPLSVSWRESPEWWRSSLPQLGYQPGGWEWDEDTRHQPCTGVQKRLR